MLSSSTRLRTDPRRRSGKNEAVTTKTPATASHNRADEAEALFDIIDDSSWNSEAFAADIEGMDENTSFDIWRRRIRRRVPRLTPEGTLACNTDDDENYDDLEAYKSWKKRMEEVKNSRKSEDGERDDTRENKENIIKKRNRNRVFLTMPTHS